MTVCEVDLATEYYFILSTCIIILAEKIIVCVCTIPYCCKYHDRCICTGIPYVLLGRGGNTYAHKKPNQSSSYLQ